MSYTYNSELDSLREEIRIRRDAYWAMLIRARIEYMKSATADEIRNSPEAGFFYHLHNTYGLRPHLLDGKIIDTYDILDERKYMLFRMKYSSS